MASTAYNASTLKYIPRRRGGLVLLRRRSPDALAELPERLSFRASGGRRFVIIDPADRLSIVAQEAVLKTLEEPPEGVVLALLTTRASFLKPTVRSRSRSVTTC